MQEQELDFSNEAIGLGEFDVTVTFRVTALDVAQARSIIAARLDEQGFDVTKEDVT